MPSTFTTRNRLELQNPGENDDTWGAKANTVFELIDEATDGYLEKSVAGGSNITLTAANSSSDESRQRVLKLTGTITANIDVIVPATEKFYAVWNATAGAFTVTLKPDGGTGLAVPQGYAGVVFTDGATMYLASPWVSVTTGQSLLNWGGTTGGTANAQTATIPGLLALEAGQTYRAIAGTTNTGAMTINFNALGAKNVLTRGGAALEAGEWVAPNAYELLYDGTSLRIQSEIIRRRVYSSNDTWNKPTGIRFVEVEMVGGGGGGGGCATTTLGENAEAGAGGGGEYAFKRILAGALGATETVTVGAAGAAGSAGINNGGDGGTSSFGAHVTAAGGEGGDGADGSSSTADAAGGAGGNGGAGGDFHFRGSDGGSGLVRNGVRMLSCYGGASHMGGSARASTGVGTEGYRWGGGGTGANRPASSSSLAGGAGRSGIVIVTEFY